MKTSPKVGKNILTILTIGMYRDPRMIYREYIQNSADQIDELTPDEQNDGLRRVIDIHIDSEKRNVTIKDVATGIPAALFEERLLNVADSHKDPSKNKGFRGIGRLAGLSYCKKLIFEASAQGEKIVSRLEMDCEKLRLILHDVKNRATASEVISAISTVTQHKKTEPSYACWFTVKLEGVDRSIGGDLLDVDKVKDFISQIAPVPFSKVKFSLNKKIYAYAEEKGYKIEEYTVRVNGEVITKPYKDDIRDKDGRVIEKLSDVVFTDITYHGDVLAWAWAAPCTIGCQLVGSQNRERGIRLRKANIQVGFHDFLNEYFSEARSNGYMIGEVHVLSKRILPNGDRNGLEVSPEASAFIKELSGKYCKQLWASTRLANTLTAAKVKIDSALHAAEEFRVIKSRKDVPSDLIKAKRESLDKAFKAAVDKMTVLKKSRAKDTASDNPFVSVVATIATKDIEETASGLDSAIRSIDKPVKTATSQPKKTVSTPDDVLASKVISILIEKGNLELALALEIWKLINATIQKKK